MGKGADGQNRGVWEQARLDLAPFQCRAIPVVHIDPVQRLCWDDLD